MSRVEVLRDGASAQYGSDAIAGVINVVPTTVRRQRGGAGRSLPGGRRRHVHDSKCLSGEFGQSDPTSRSIQRNDAAALAAAGFPVRDPAQIWGSPEVDDNVKLFANTGYTFGGGVELYGFGSYHTKRVEGGSRGSVFVSRRRDSLIGDVLDAQDGVVDGSANCPVVRVVARAPFRPSE